MIKLGNNDITLKVGSTDVSAAYLGSILVYTSTPPEPKWIATYSGGTTSSAECDASSAITQNEIDGTDLVSVEIGDCITTIGNYAFNTSSYEGYTSLTSVTIPDSVTTIGKGAFERCSSLSSVTIPNSVTSIGNDIFYQCTSLTSVTLPSGITSLPTQLFHSCSSLPSVTIPDGVTTIGDRVFTSCSTLSNITIPSGVTTIGGLVFYQCTGLTSVTIPSGVTSIGDAVFANCSSLTSVTVLATTPPTIGGSVFYATNNCPIYVPSGSLNTYKSASGWSSYASRIQAIPEPSPQWVDYASGEIIPTDLDIYGVSGTSASLCNTFGYVDDTIYIHLERNAVIADIGPGCYSGSYPISGNIEITFSDVVDAGCSDSYRLNHAAHVVTGVKLLIYQ